MTSVPILQFDGEPQAIIEPSKQLSPLQGMPACAVITFFQDVINHFVEQGLAEEITSLQSEMGMHPIYRHTYKDQSVALFHPGIGAPLASAALELSIALGCRNFIVCGGAGVLDRELAQGHLVVPTEAIRDEGTSYHYIHPESQARPDPDAIAAIERVLQGRNVDYVLGKTWTTDAIFRETRSRMGLRREQGCLTVEMEAAALFAVAQFREVKLAQILYCGDNLDDDEWDDRGWRQNWSVREILVELATESVLSMAEPPV